MLLNFIVDARACNTSKFELGVKKIPKEDTAVDVKIFENQMKGIFKTNVVQENVSARNKAEI